ncbi:MAG: RdgB/HAM1 family non-canonical purine NTP pyrophosphatase [Bacteroidota bacterium]
MIKELVFATNNEYKASEVAKLLEGQYKILCLKDIGCDVDIAETGNTFAENAALKSNYVYEHFGISCFADDSGLEVMELNNNPGIFSARYSGVRDDQKNMDLLLKNLGDSENRKAQFRTVVSLSQSGENFFFEGIVEGLIRNIPAGDQGFGYDPIFQPEGYKITFAQMSTGEKNQISHRAIAMGKLITFLKEQAAF